MRFYNNGVMRFMIPAVLIFLAIPGRAAFTRSLMDRTDTEPLFDSEYFLDLNSFSWSRAWDDAWSASSGGYRVNGASLDCCDLYLDQTLLFTRRLTPKLEFRFRFVELSDKDRQESHHWLEFEHEIGAGWSAEVFGEPTYRKEDSDIGMGIRWKRGAWEARARRSAVDWNLNGRGSTTQSYSLKPYTDEVSFKMPLGAWSLRLAGDLDEPTRRLVPDERRSFFYRRLRGRAEAGSDEGWAPRVRYSYEEQAKINTVAPGGTGTSEEARRKVHEASASARLRPTPDDEFEPGAAFLLRAARADVPGSSASGTFYRRWEVQPYLRWRRSLSTRLTSELSPSFSVGENRLRRPGGAGPERYESVGEAKLGASLEVKFGAAGLITLGGVLDVDKPGKAWDGGSVKAMFLF